MFQAQYVNNFTACLNFAAFAPTTTTAGVGNTISYNGVECHAVKNTTLRENPTVTSKSAWRRVVGRGGSEKGRQGAFGEGVRVERQAGWRAGPELEANGSKSTREGAWAR